MNAMCSPQFMPHGVATLFPGHDHRTDDTPVELTPATTRRFTQGVSRPLALILPGTDAQGFGPERIASGRVDCAGGRPCGVRPRRCPATGRMPVSDLMVLSSGSSIMIVVRLGRCGARATAPVVQ